MFFNPETCRDESEVERKFVQQYLLPALGYLPGTWSQEIVFGSLWNYRLVSERLCLFVETKHPKDNLNAQLGKARSHIISLGVLYGLLTNGRELRILERKNKQVQEIYRCAGSEVERKLGEIKAIIGRNEIRQRRFGTPATPTTPKVESATVQTPPVVAGAQELAPTLPPTPDVTEPVESIAPTLVSAPANLASQAAAPVVTPEPPTTAAPTVMAPAAPEQVALVAPSARSDVKQVQKGKKKMKTIAVYHNKGGVGKTTAVINLAAALSKQGLRVLVIDLDSQANTTFAVGLVKFDDEKNDNLKERNILHVLRSEDFYPIAEVAQIVGFCSQPIAVVPAHIDLMSAEAELNNLDNSRMVLIQKLLDVENIYDIVLIDTPPSLNLYARIALIAADYLIIPSDLRPFANQGLNNVKGLIKDVNSFRKGIGKKPLTLLGVLASKISTNAKFRQFTLAKRMKTIEERYGLQMMESIIFERDDLVKCTEQLRLEGDEEVPDPHSVLDFKPDSESAEEFRGLAQEVLRKLNR